MRGKLDLLSIADLAIAVCLSVLVPLSLDYVSYSKGGPNISFTLGVFWDYAMLLLRALDGMIHGNTEPEHDIIYLFFASTTIIPTILYMSLTAIAAGIFGVSQIFLKLIRSSIMHFVELAGEQPVEKLRPATMLMTLFSLVFLSVAIINKIVDWVLG